MLKRNLTALGQSASVPSAKCQPALVSTCENANLFEWKTPSLRVWPGLGRASLPLESTCLGECFPWSENVDTDEAVASEIRLLGASTVFSREMNFASAALMGPRVKVAWVSLFESRVKSQVLINSK